MLKRLLIFVGTFTAVKLFAKDKDNNTPHWFYFSVDTPRIILKIEKSYDNKNKFFYNLNVNSSAYYPIDFNSELGTFARIVLAEAHTEQNVCCFQAIACSIRNRLKSEFFNYKNYFDVIYAPNQYQGINLSVFKNTEIEIKKHKEYLISYLRAISSVLTAVYMDSYFAGGAIGFNKSQTHCPFSEKYYICEKIDLKCKCKTVFWNAKPK